MKARFLFFLLTFLTIATVSAQDSLRMAFSKSYTFEKAGDYTSAIKSIKQSYDERSYECNVRLGYLSYIIGGFKEATNYYTRAIALMPYAIEARLGYVLPASKLEKWDDVLAQYHAVLKIDPQNTSVNYKAGMIYYYRKNYAAALPLFERIVNLYPFDYDGMYMYAWTNLQMGKFKEAKILFNKVLLISPNDKSALEGLSLIKK